MSAAAGSTRASMRLLHARIHAPLEGLPCAAAPAPPLQTELCCQKLRLPHVLPKRVELERERLQKRLAAARACVSRRAPVEVVGHAGAPTHALLPARRKLGLWPLARHLCCLRPPGTGLGFISLPVATTVFQNPLRFPSQFTTTVPRQERHQRLFPMRDPNQFKRIKVCTTKWAHIGATDSQSWESFVQLRKRLLCSCSGTFCGTFCGIQL